MSGKDAPGDRLVAMLEGLKKEGYISHGLDPDQDVVRMPVDSIVDYLAGEGERVALVLVGGVNYLTGEVLSVSSQHP